MESAHTRYHQGMAQFDTPEEVQAPGDYALVFKEGAEGPTPAVEAIWFMLTPGVLRRLPSRSEDWTVTVNEDGSVSVTPDIVQYEITNEATSETVPAWVGSFDSGSLVERAPEES